MAKPRSPQRPERIDAPTWSAMSELHQADAASRCGCVLSNWIGESFTLFGSECPMHHDDTMTERDWRFFWNGLMIGLLGYAIVMLAAMLHGSLSR